MFQMEKIHGSSQARGTWWSDDLMDALWEGHGENTWKIHGEKVVAILQPKYTHDSTPDYFKTYRAWWMYMS